jgi:hypothetical protein
VISRQSRVLLVYRLLWPTARDKPSLPLLYLKSSGPRAAGASPLRLPAVSRPGTLIIHDDPKFAGAVFRAMSRGPGSMTRRRAVEPSSAGYLPPGW